MSERIQKLLALAGVGSRREIEGWISEGRIIVNGVAARLGDQATRHDTVVVDGKKIDLTDAGRDVRVLAYNKPVGEVCTRTDPEGRPTVFQHLPKTKNERWINIGRLDINTSGLLLFTTDGELANKMMHPSSGVDREYAVRVRGDVDDAMLERLREGVLLEDGLARFTDIKYFDGDGQNKWYHVVLMEGKNREVRRLWESQGISVSRLKRVRYGCIFLPARIPVGTWIELNQKEVNNLYDMTELSRKSVKRKIGKEKEQFERAARRQKVRQSAGTKRVAEKAPETEVKRSAEITPKKEFKRGVEKQPRKDMDSRVAKGPKPAPQPPVKKPRSK